MNSDIVTILKKLGFTEYEAKAYIALLEKSPLSGYGVALNSGVPRSKIYEVLDGLVKNGDVIVTYGAPVLYSPLPAKELIVQKKKQSDKYFDEASQSLETFSERVEERDNIWSILGRQQILNRINELISMTESSLLIKMSFEDIKALEDQLKKASKNGIDIHVITDNGIILEYAKVYQVLEEVDIENKWFAISRDTSEVMTGLMTMGKESLAACTMHPSLVIPITTLLKSSLLLATMLSNHPKEFCESYGNDLLEFHKIIGFKKLEEMIKAHIEI
jgi:sugar-specific transcriptional regulator TrmB